MGVRQVKSSGGNVIGTFPSLKMREQIPYESTIECKPTAHLNEAHSQQQLALGQAWANANQHLFVVITDTDLRTGHRLANLKLLWRYSRLCVPSSITSRCRSILIAQADGLSLEALAAALSNTSSSFELLPYLYRLVFEHILQTDLTQPLSPRTFVQLQLPISSI